jgi:hypothetical protein
MTRLREISHVVIKDIQEARRLVLLYLAVVVVATAHGAGLGVFRSGTFGASMVFVVIVGSLLAASVVQADSPTRSDAFWATHPFRRSSMLGAKLAFALLVVLVAVAGQTIGIYSYDLRPFASSSFVTGPALFFSVALLGVMLLASVTRDLRSFIIVAIVIPVVVLFTLATFERHPTTATLAPESPGLGDLLTHLWGPGVAAGVALLVWLYLKRDDRRRTRTVSACIVALTLMSMCSGSRAPDSPEAMIAGPAPLTVALEPADPRAPSQHGQLPIVIHVSGLGEGRSARLDVPLIELRLHDGSVLHAPVENSIIDAGGVWPSRFVPPRIAGIRWLVTSPSEEVRNTVVPRLTGAQRRAVAEGIAGVAVEGRVSIWESLPSGTLPIVVGAETTANGRRTRIAAWTPDDELSVVVVDESSIDPSPASAWPFTSMFGREGFALVNESRGEAVPLGRTQSSGGLDGLVLPGAPLRSEQVHFGLRAGPTADTMLPDADWLRGARLMPVRSHLLGVYRIRTEVKDWPAAVAALRSSYSRTGSTAPARAAER